MRRIIFLFLGLFLFFAESALATTPGKVTFGAVGSAKVGMTPEEILELFPGMYEISSPFEDPGDCYYLVEKGSEANNEVSGVSFMVTHGHISRIDVNTHSLETTEGIKVGDSEEKVKLSYKRAQVEPHAYAGSEGSYITVLNSGGNLAIRFEINDGKVTSYHTGKVSEVALVEGCL